MVRIWNVPCSELDRYHLLGEHLELHIIWNSLVLGRRGWANHPETRRWRGRLRALYGRHDEQVAEMQARGYTGHKTPLDPAQIPEDDLAEWPHVTEERIQQDRADLVAHFPGWRKAKAAALAPQPAEQGQSPADQLEPGDAPSVTESPGP